MNDITTMKVLSGTANARCFLLQRMSLTGNHISLKAQLDACRRAFEASIPPGIGAASRVCVAELVQTGLVREAVKAGEKAPLFRLRSNTGDLVALSEALDCGLVALSFFRGGWGPFSLLELQALAETHPEIERPGATLIGLSPLPDADSHSSFPILTDTGCRVAARYRIAFPVPPQFRPAYLALGYPERLKKAADRWVLPLPATYIIDPNGIVAFSYVNADYPTRLQPAEIAVALAHLRARTNPSSSVGWGYRTFRLGIIDNPR
jgi:peroxiredoxin